MKALRIARLTNKRVLKLVVAVFIIACLFCLAFPFIQFFANYTIRSVGGQHLFGGAPIHDPARMPLPSVVVEPGPTLCCRMLLCDFRFPLPKRSGVATIDPVSGGWDTIKGAIYVTNTGGGAVDLRAYARSLHEAGFRVFDDFDGSSFPASSPDGGCLQVEGDQFVTVYFSFFGDY